ncbi:MAG: DUF4093 domain-containing protein, partial [Erysipelotrichaceae bacterium]|nr:DUF4093 domain-containing protein [Erysipelotrichaceae bacterium]
AIMQKAPKCRHVFIEKKDAVGKRNVGIEYVDDRILREALDQTVSFGETRESISRREYSSLGLSGNSAKRDYVSSQLHLGRCNNKRLWKYLNMLGVDYEKVREIAESYERESDRM